MGEKLECVGAIFPKIWRKKAKYVELKRPVYEGVGIPTAISGSEKWWVSLSERRNLKLYVKNCL